MLFSEANYFDEIFYLIQCRPSLIAILQLVHWLFKELLISLLIRLPNENIVLSNIHLFFNRSKLVLLIE